MLDDHDTRLELGRQLAVVRGRIDETVTKLAGLKEGLTAAGLDGVPAASMVEGKADLFNCACGWRWRWPTRSSGRTS